MLTRAQIAAFEKAVATANNMLTRLELLEKLKGVSPQLEQRINELRQKRDYLHALAETALEFHNQVTQSQG